jgi:NADH:ubiquinone oxidoreductase subunit H
MIFLLLLIGVLSVAFITLIERKVLGLRQIRFGPNKLSLAGLFQPVMDGIKLLSKTYFDSKLRIISLLGPLGVMFLFLIN